MKERMLTHDQIDGLIDALTGRYVVVKFESHDNIMCSFTGYIDSKALNDDAKFILLTDYLGLPKVTNMMWVNYDSLMSIDIVAQLDEYDLRNS